MAEWSRVQMTGLGNRLQQRRHALDRINIPHCPEP